MLKKILMYSLFILVTIPALAEITKKIQEDQFLGIWDCKHAYKTVETSFIFGVDKKVEVIINYLELKSNEPKPVLIRKIRNGIWQILEGQLILTLKSEELKHFDSSRWTNSIEQGRDKSIKSIVYQPFSLFDVKWLNEKTMRLRKPADNLDMICKMVKKG